MSETKSCEFCFEKGETCKRRWRFELSSGPEGPVIERVEIEAHPKDSGGEQGCKGHPKSLAALVRGRAVASLPTDELADAACGMRFSCGQALAKCLRELGMQS